MFKTSTQPVVASTRGGMSSARAIFFLAFTATVIVMVLTLFGSGVAASAAPGTTIDPSATNPASPETQPTLERDPQSNRNTELDADAREATPREPTEQRYPALG